MEDLEQFAIEVPQATLDDLAERLARTRWPAELDGPGWEDGTSPAFLRELVGRWRTGFDWRAQEAAINRFPQFRATVDGIGLHFVHVRGKGPAPLPLVYTHGWPSSFYELLPLVGLLTDPTSHGGDPTDAFDVVIPSLPGYGFSDPLPGRGNSARIPGQWARLMTQVLGYTRFAAHGGDLGAYVTNRLGYEFPEQVLGIHVTMVAEADLGPGAAPPSDAERVFLAERVAGQEDRRRLQPHAADPPPDPGLRAVRLPGGTGRLDSRQVAGVERLRRRPLAPLHQGPAVDHGDPVLGDRHDRVVVPDLPGLGAEHGRPS